MFQLSGPTRATIVRLAEFLEDTSDPWWILGSAAIALSGVDPGGVRDIDVLVSKRDAIGLMQIRALPNVADGGGERFKSEIFLRPALGDVSVEVMANYVIGQGNGWWPVELRTRQPVSVGAMTVYVPELLEQIELLERLGRPKDLCRIRLIQCSGQY